MSTTGTFFSPDFLKNDLINDQVSFHHPAPQEFYGFPEVAREILRDSLLGAHFRGENHCPDPVFDWGPMPEDPSVRLRWEVAQELTPVLQKRFQAIFALERRQKQEAAMRHLHEKLRKVDPLYERTMHILEYHTGCLHTPCRRALSRELEDNPHAFMELYGDLREIALRVEHRLKNRKRKIVGPSKNDRMQQIKALKQKMNAGLGKDDDIIQYLECMGVGDRLDS